MWTLFGGYIALAADPNIVRLPPNVKYLAGATLSRSPLIALMSTCAISDRQGNGEEIHAKPREEFAPAGPCVDAGEEEVS
jgi:hypothetical protein